MDIQKCFFHVDLDAFFASVEQILHPEYKGKPLIISGDPHHKRNVVSTASYEARKYGVHSAMPSFKAYELCPQGIFVEPHMDDYYEYSQKVMSILEDFSPDIIQLSIDEACLDMTGTTRLFGEPEEAAKKIKNRIKEETGLTISIGIASNSYLAKICSEVKKPDGLFQVLPGDEEKFIETLPLKDIWGVGQKTLERLNTSGFRSVKDIKSHSKNFLKTIVGEAGSSFLYNVCRGMEPENFRSEPKSHSVSVETTFEFDLTDINTIETELLDLSSQMMHRLLISSKTSLTVFLKIRYEDFTTISAQQTYETPVLCTDDLYSRILSLFNRKYESGRGIRLLGVGVHKSVPISSIVQPELFESENIKKQTVEKAILQLETKHPEIKISKARLIKGVKMISSILLFTAFLNFTANAQTTEPDTIKSQTVRPDSIRPDVSETSSQKAATVTDESKLPPKKTSDKTSIFNFKFDDYDQNSIEFLADGFWNLKLSDTFNSTFGYGKEFSGSFSTPVFEQEVDLSLWFMLNNHFFVQGAFADKFNKNIYAIGYQSEDTLKEIKVSNRNIVFPDDYSLTDISRSIGGGDNQAPGISASLSKDKWKIDAAVRYDMLSTFDKTFYGKNAVTNLKIPQTNFMTGFIYVMPDSGFAERITGVYIESSEGNYTDEAGRTYKKISENNYLILPSQNKIILSQDSKASKKNGITPCLLFEFDSDAETLLTSSLGNFGTSETPGTGYLGSIQKFFSSNTKNKVDVTRYSYSKKKASSSVPDYAGTDCTGFFTRVNGKSLLLAQHSSGFSPFMASYRYDGGASAVSEVQVASSTSEIQSSVYAASITDSLDTVKSDFFSTKHTYVDVYNPDYTLSSTGITGKINYSSPELNFPFADRNPGTYLGFGFSTDECVMLKSFSQTSRIDIGTKAVPGTVTVYKNGVIDPSAKYNPQTGEVTLSSGVSDSDKIYITWFEDSSDAQTGMLTAAAGFKYDFTEKLKGDVAASTRWALNPDLKYAEYNKNSAGFATIAAGIDYNEEKLKVKNITGFTYQVDNVTGKYKISGMDSVKPSTAYLISDAARNLPDGFAPFINPRPSSDENIIELSSSNNCSVSRQTGIKDSGISGYSIPVSYNFNAGSSSETMWASNSVITSAAKNVLSNTTKFNLAVKLSEEFIKLAQDSTVETKIYLQLGVDSNEDFKIEEKGFIPTWKIFDSKTALSYYDVETPLSLTKNGSQNLEWQTVSVTLKDSDRSQITENYNIRIIITSDKKSTTVSNAGTIFIGPYEAITQGIFFTADKNISVSTEELKTANSAVSSFNKDTNYAEYINWKIENPSKISDTSLSVYKYFDEVDISSYRKINIYFAYNVKDDSTAALPATGYDTPFTVTLDQNASTASSQASSPDAGKKAVELKLSPDQLKKYIGSTGSSIQMHKLEIDRISRKVYIDSNPVDYLSLYINPNVVPSRVKIDFNSAVKTKDDGTLKLYKQGTFAIDEFYLSDNSSKMILQNLTKIALNHKGAVLSTPDNFAIISDPSITANGEISSSFYTSPDFENKFGFSGNADAEVTIATIKIGTEIARASESKHAVTNAGHSISTTSPLFNILSFEENYSLNKDDKTVNKQNSAQLNFGALKIPLTLKAQTKIESDSWAVTQETQDSLSLNIGTKYKYGLNVKAKASQKKKPYQNGSLKLSTDNYFTSWFEASKYQFSFGDEDAAKRTVGLSIDNKFTFPIAGFSPELNFAETGNYTSDTQNLFSDTTDFTAAFPFKLGQQNFSFTYSKSSTLVKNTVKGGDYGTDINNLCTSMAKRDWYFYAGPFYDLFSADLATKVLSTIPDARKKSELSETETGQSVNYNADYSFTWKRPIFANQKDFFIPTVATLSLVRDISTAENIADTYQIKATAGYTAVNIFSKDGNLPLLKWCESDEYNMSLQAVLKIPRNEPENLKQVYNVFVQANFYKTMEDVLRTGMQFSFQDKNNWSAKASVVYNRRSHFSPVLEIGKLFKRDFDYSNLKITRTDSIDINLSSSLADSTNAKLRQYQSLDVNHEVGFYILKQFALTANLGLQFAHTRDEIFNLGFTAGLGGKFNF